MKNIKITKSKYFISWLVVWLSILSTWVYASVTWAGTIWSLFELVWSNYRLLWDNIKDNTIDSSEIEENAITNSELGNDAVKSWNIKNWEVKNVDLSTSLQSSILQISTNNTDIKSNTNSIKSNTNSINSNTKYIDSNTKYINSINNSWLSASKISSWTFKQWNYAFPNKVWIWTEQPAADLDVNWYIIARNRIRFAEDTSNKKLVWNIDNSNWLFRIFHEPNMSTSWTVRMAITKYWKVWIWTHIPEEKLDVRWNLKVSWKLSVNWGDAKWNYSTAMGYNTIVNWNHSIAMWANLETHWDYSTIVGVNWKSDIDDIFTVAYNWPIFQVKSNWDIYSKWEKIEFWGNNNSIVPNKHVIPIGAGFVKSTRGYWGNHHNEGYWDKGFKDFNCKTYPKIPKWFSLFERWHFVDVASRWTCAKAPFCDEKWESCHDYKIDVACYVNTEWLAWYNKLNKDYKINLSENFVCNYWKIK
jgi:hypothetical protein